MTDIQLEEFTQRLRAIADEVHGSNRMLLDDLHRDMIAAGRRAPGQAAADRVTKDLRRDRERTGRR